MKRTEDVPLPLYHSFFQTLVVLLVLFELALFLGLGGGVAPFRPLQSERPSLLKGPHFTTGDDTSCAAHAAPSFWSMGVAVATDKVTLSMKKGIKMSHSYQFAYERYVRPRRCEKLDILEIGLGCGMPYTDSTGAMVPEAMRAGHSVPLWLAFLPRASLNIFEFNEKCARDFFQNDPLHIGDPLHSRVKLFVGNQANDADLEKAMAAMGPQDIIIDDGGHSMMQQETSLRVLFKFLKPGGICALRSDSAIYKQRPFADMTTPLNLSIPPNRYSGRFADKLFASRGLLAR
jgi:hypothetical protein